MTNSRSGRMATLVFAALTLAGASAVQVQAGQAPPANAPVPGPDLAEAQRMIAAAHAAAAKLNVGLSCAVVDSRGDLVAIARMDRARFFTTDIARGKAVSSAILGQPSANLAQLASSPILTVINNTGTRMVPVQGAVPLMRNNQVIGAIGCSGGTGQQDEDSAKAGQQALQGVK